MFEQEKDAKRRALAVADERSKENTALREMLREAKAEFECLRNWMDRAAASDYRYKHDLWGRPMKNDKSVKIGRLALRHEGNFWNAYYALLDSMDDAVPLGSIAMAFVGDNEDRKQAFVDLMRECAADIIEKETGRRPTWPDGVQPAPEHERAGHS